MPRCGCLFLSYFVIILLALFCVSVSFGSSCLGVFFFFVCVCISFHSS